MDILQDLLGSMPVGEFLHRHFTRVPFAMPNRAMHYTQAFTAADFAAMVEGSRSVLRVVQNGRLIQDYARLSWAEAQVQHRRGHTLLVRYAERSCAKLQTMAEAFAQFFHSPVDIQVYLTPGQSQAFGWHYDLEEVFISGRHPPHAVAVRPGGCDPEPRNIRRDPIRPRFQPAMIGIGGRVTIRGDMPQRVRFAGLAQAWDFAVERGVVVLEGSDVVGSRSGDGVCTRLWTPHGLDGDDGTLQLPEARRHFQTPLETAEAFRHPATAAVIRRAMNQ